MGVDPKEKLPFPRQRPGPLYHDANNIIIVTSRVCTLYT